VRRNSRISPDPTTHFTFKFISRTGPKCDFLYYIPNKYLQLVLNIASLCNRDPVVDIRTTRFNIQQFTFCPHSVFMCFVCISEQTAIISLHSINWLVFITETECVYCAVRTGSIYTILRSAHTVYLCVLCGSENKQPLFPYTALNDWFL